MKPESSIAQDDIDNFIKIKRRCFLCPSHRGRKVRQTYVKIDKLKNKRNSDKKNKNKNANRKEKLELK